MWPSGHRERAKKATAYMPFENIGLQNELTDGKICIKYKVPEEGL
jgi:hypothetical protein